MKGIQPRFLAAALCAGLLACATGGRMAPDETPQFPDIVEQFKYGSVGIEAEEGIPYWIWQVLPRIFADKLPRPGGYSSLGVVWEPGRELPVGFSRLDLFGGPRIAINCAFCHTATVRKQPLDPPMIVPAGPAQRINPQAYARFLYAAAEDPRFNAGEILKAISTLTRLSWTERLQYRFLLIPATRRGLRRQQRDYAWMNRNPDWGPGRIDPFNPVKFRILKQPVDATIGNSDMMSIWKMRGRQGQPLHWDGLTTSLREAVQSGAIGDGASRKSIRLKTLARIEQWLLDAPPPAYPFDVDAGLAARGRPVYEQQCASCHDPGGARVGRVIPLEEVGTDRHRLDMWTAPSATAYNAFAEDYDWDFDGFQKTNGYVAVPLDGLWLRAPYLHNGSVPSLEELLEPPERRRTTFHRGYDVYDPARVGFVSDGDAAALSGTLYDTRRPGNGNGGHLYGITLAGADKNALIEFLKTK